MSELAVIGGGAAGMMAAIAAAGKGLQTDLYEKNEKLGKKIYITGKGRCNVTNACAVEDFFPKVITNPKFLYSALYDFSNQDMMEFLKTAGLSIKVERGNRVFPVSDKSSDVIRTLQNECRKAGVRVHLNTEVMGIEPEETEGFRLFLKDGGRTIERKADRVILATGGVSYPSTGSTGQGHTFAEQLGHTVTKLSPALVPFTAEESWVKELQGLALKNVEVTIRDGKKQLFQEFGEMLFTHFGVSGPAILSGSSVCAKAIAKHPLTLEINLKPALDREQLEARLVREFTENSRKHYKNVLQTLLPSSLVPVVAMRSGIDPEKDACCITKEERERLLDLLQRFTVTLTGLRGFDEAIVTQGGVTVKEINPSTMESKRIPGLYFAGELIDVDACTGGYNLQIAWSTGRLAGVSAAESLSSMIG